MVKPAPQPVSPAHSAHPAPYMPPRLEALGAWSALTLQQTIPIGPGGLLLAVEGTSRLA